MLVIAVLIVLAMIVAIAIVSLGTKGEDDE